MSEYRVVRQTFVWEGQKTESYTLRRCVEQVGRMKCGMDASPEGESLDALRKDLQEMLAALDKPVLEQKRTGLTEVKK